MKFVVSSFRWAHRHKRDFDAVISLEDPDAKNKLRFHKNPHPEHLILTFVDLDEPAPYPYSEWSVFRLATIENVENAISFGRQFTNVLVHCQAGIGRSSAIALALWADHLGRGNEQEALNRLLAQRPEAVPNLHVVKLADDFLKLDGKLISTVIAWDKQLIVNQNRRKANRKSHFLYYSLHEVE